MPDVVVEALVQPTVYWKLLGYPNANGVGSYAAPIQIMTRWEKHASTSTDPNKGPISLTHTVYVSCPVLNGSKLWLGCLKDLPASLDLRTVPTTRDYDECPDIDGRNPQRTVIAS